MQAAACHPREDERLRAIYNLKLSEGGSEPTFQDVVEIARTVSGLKTAFISIVEEDRQWFKARVGLEATETPREVSFCSHAILKPNEPLVITDTAQDPRFCDNPLVTGSPNIRTYAGFPILSPGSSLPIGTLCVLHDEPRKLDETQLNCLERLAAQVGRILSYRRIMLRTATLNSAASDRREQQLRFTTALHRDLAPLAEQTTTAVDEILRFHDANVPTGLKRSLINMTECSDSLTLISEFVGHRARLTERGLALADADWG